MWKPKFAPTFYAGFVLLALVGAVIAAQDDPNGAMRVSLWGKNISNADTRISVNGDGEIGINDGNNSITVDGTVTVTDGAGALNTIVDSGTLTAVTTITNPVTVTDGAGALNVIVDSLPTVTVTDGAGALNTIVDSGTLTAVTSITNPVTVTDGSGAMNVIIDSSATLTVNAHAVTVASGGIASGAIASGAVASGAVASGAYASGSISAGAIAAGASSLVKLEDVLSADADAGVPAMCTRKATAANVSGSDGDYEFLQCSAGRLWTSTTNEAGSAIIGKVGIDQTTPGTTNLVQVTDGAGALNVIIDSSATLTVNAHAVTVASGGIASGAVASGAFASGSIGSGAIASGAVASGAYASGSIAAGAIAAGASSLVKQEDVLSADADAGVPAMCTRKATAANVSGSDGDYEFLQCSAGRLWTSSTIDAALPAGSAIVGKVGIDQTTPGTTNLVALSAETTKVIGTVRNIGNVGGVFDAVTAAAVPANALQSGFRSDGGLAAGTAALTTPTFCQDSAVVNASTDNANTEIVALTASETIYVCGMMIIADGTVSAQWIYGTGTACATGETDLSGSFPLAINTGHSSFSPFPVMKTIASNAFCIELTGTGNVQGWVTYTKY